MPLRTHRDVYNQCYHVRDYPKKEYLSCATDASDATPHHTSSGHCSLAKLCPQWLVVPSLSDKSIKLVGDGLPRLLMGDEFYKRVINHEKAMEDEKVMSKIHRKQKEQQSNLFLAWKEADDARKKRNKEQKTAYHQQLTLWNHEREQAKTERRQVSWVKPKLGKLEAPLPKPGSRSVDKVEVAGDEGDDGNLDEGTDVGMDSSGEDGCDNVAIMLRLWEEVTIRCWCKCWHALITAHTFFAS
ncbi:hypothetical protein JVT61DRAFT_4833 [Boletus reticuloceps]|uniref:Uncharacterized protein n=1 Tax=Boletus reticuloceps TaxID=495285 RepID=A0A8I3A937_9AGAM|nr:hypothetical protein JVT61DRAFT_4833 [Boletus reticuloceps]